MVLQSASWWVKPLSPRSCREFRVRPPRIMRSTVSIGSDARRCETGVEHGAVAALFELRLEKDDVQDFHSQRCEGANQPRRALTPALVGSSHSDRITGPGNGRH